MRKYIIEKILICCFCFCCLDGFSKHIIGGDITYKCLGNGDYEIEMHVYRDDKEDVISAEIDNPAFFSVYRCGSLTNCTTLSQGSQNIDFRVSPLRVIDVTPNKVECLDSVVPDVEEGIYKFKLSDFDISLEPSNDSYFIVYQRCCRNDGIKNIIDGDNEGSTYFVEITPSSQKICNSSPVFNNFPDLIICQNFEMTFDHSASDPDGDSLVYYFANPISGGGNDITTFGYERCTGAKPTPPCPPTQNSPPYFREISFRTPFYNKTFPLGKTADDTSNTTVVIDSLSGLIKGVPGVAGLFVITVIVEEYRDSVLLGSIRRDFQYTVGDCKRNIEAIIKSDQKVGNAEYVSTICKQKNVVFKHESMPSIYVDKLRWEFDIGNGNKVTQTTDEAIITFPDPGKFTGLLIVNPGSANCEDSAYINVNIFPETIADFEFSYDTCKADFVTFTNESSTQADRIKSIAWDFKDGRRYTTDQVEYFFPRSGNQPVTLTVTDNNNCSVSKTESVPYFPLEEETFIVPSLKLGCAPEEITFNDFDSLLTDDYSIEWNFGDGSTSEAVSPTFTYEESGFYDVSIDISNPFSCRIILAFPGLVRIIPGPIADFVFSPDEINVTDPEVTFTDLSQNAVAWEWDFDGHGASMEINPVFSFPDTGMQTIRLVVFHENGCTDTTFQMVDIFPSGEVFMPNAFTPNGDGKNDIFLPKTYLLEANNFTFHIWNRWGEKVFFSQSADVGWNGFKNNSGKPSPQGVYTYLIEFVDSRGNLKQLKGYATLVR